MQVHGIGCDTALNLHKAAEQGSAIAREDWMKILLDTVGAVSEVHKSGYLEETNCGGKSRQQCLHCCINRFRQSLKNN